MRSLAKFIWLSTLLISVSSFAGSGFTETEIKEIKGVDANSDGIRDDIESWLQLEYGTSPEQIKAVRFLSRTIQSSLLVNSKTVEDIGKDMAAAIACVYDSFSNSNMHTRSKVLGEIRKKTIDREIRAKAYLNSQKILAGQVIATPSSSRKLLSTCK